jgi:hypothetical protein
LFHQAATKGYVDNRFISYTPTEQMDFRFEALYAKKADLQQTDTRIVTLLRNLTRSAIQDPFAFLDYNVFFLYRQTPFGIFNKSIVYYFNPVASFSFEPPLLYKNTYISTAVTPDVITAWTIGFMTIEDLLARGYSIQRGHPLDTIERRWAAVEQFTDRQWKYFSTGPPEFHEYPLPPPPPSLPPTIPDFTVAPFFTSIIVAYTVADDVGVPSAYAELLDTDNALLELKEALDTPSGVVEFLNVQSGRSYIVRLTAVDANDNLSFREEYVTIADVTAPVINEFQVYSPTPGQLKVDVNVTDDTGGSVVCIAYLYWIFDLGDELDSYTIELTDGLGSVTFRELDPERTYVVELYVRDSSWNARYDNREGYPNGAGI